MIVRLDARHRGGEERGADPALTTRLGRPGGAGSQRERGMNDVMGSGGEWKASQVRTDGAGFAPASAGEARQW